MDQVNVMPGTASLSRRNFELQSCRRPKRSGHHGGILMTALTRRGLLGSAAAIAAGSFVAPTAHAVVPSSGKQAPGFYRYKLGDFEVTAFNDGFVKVPKLDSFVVNQPLEAIQKAVEESYIPKDDVRVHFNPLLVNTGSKLVLFDTGFGDNGSPTQGGLLAN